jgi:hypothetical protein
MTFKCFRFVSLLLSRKKKKKKKKQNGVVLVFNLFIAGVGRRPKFHAIKKTQRKKERERREQKKPQKQVHTKK